MFGPLKYIFYMLILAGLTYLALYILPSFFTADQIQIKQEITLPKPQLVQNPTKDAANE
ncbi:MAG: hypothetical protein OCD03_06155 [Hyphomicrobiales bacterium]